MAYPPTSAEALKRAHRFQHLRDRTDDDAAYAILQARGEFESLVPDASSLSGTLADFAKTICTDLAVWHLRAEVERDEDGDLPRVLRTMRETLEDRMQQFGTRIGHSDGLIAFEPFPEMEPPALPSGGS